MIDLTKIKNTDFFKKRIIELMLDFVQETTATSTFESYISKFIFDFFSLNFKPWEYFEYLEINLNNINSEEYDLDNDSNNLLRLYVFLINLFENAGEEFIDKIKNENWRPFSKVLKLLYQNQFYKKLIDDTKYEIRYYEDLNLNSGSLVKIFFLTEKLPSIVIESSEIELIDGKGTDLSLRIKQYFDPTVKNHLAEKVTILRDLSPIWDKYAKKVRNKSTGSLPSSLEYKIWDELSSLMNNKNIRHDNGKEINMSNIQQIDDADWIMNVFLAGLCIIKNNSRFK